MIISGLLVDFLLFALIVGTLIYSGIILLVPILWYQDTYRPWAQEHPDWWKGRRQSRKKKKRLSLDDMADVPSLGVTLGADGEIESIGKCK